MYMECLVFCIFFFKQKTAYEMRISDWSSDVCSSDLAKLLDEVTPDGFCYRVDLRLRPFGNAGRVALSFAAMEQYFQREGRDWEQIGRASCRERVCQYV